MATFVVERPSWKELLDSEGFLPLPVAHDALTARLIEQAGFKAYQIGGFALEAALYGFPDADLTHLGEKSLAARRIMQASKLPCLVDGDDGYGDAKNVVHTIETYERMGAAAIFIEDQKPPKECGHMAGKVVVPAEAMVRKIKAACEARENPEAIFILARTDARQPEGVDATIRRAQAYLDAGADGAYVEGPKTKTELKAIGKAFKGRPLATSVLEHGGVTPWVDFDELRDMGFSMVLYPATVLFQVTRTIEEALHTLRAGQPAPREKTVDMKAFEQIVDLDRWRRIQKKFKGGPGWDEG